MTIWLYLVTFCHVDRDSQRYAGLPTTTDKGQRASLVLGDSRGGPSITSITSIEWSLQLRFVCFSTGSFEEDRSHPRRLLQPYPEQQIPAP
jgi:hypothetical protein